MIRSDLLLGLEAIEPSGCDFEQAPAVESVDALSTTLLLLDEPSVVEHAQMTRGRRPRAIESLSDLAGRHLATAMMQDQQDVPP